MKNRPRLRKKSTRFYLVFPPLLCLLAALWGFSAFAADDSVCAEVKLEIKQELTLERQAFDAHMRINNGLSHITLEDMGVDVNFSDEEGNSVLASSDPDDPDALFFIRLDSMENIDNVDGTGLVQPSSAADIHWLIIPATGASNGLEQGTLYYVGATLSYTIGGEEQVTEVTPDYIFVKPMPELTLDYFLPPDVYGDDAFTSEIEPPVPFSLGVRVSNSGDGVAKDLKIGSAQPKIVENEQGLLIGFVIEGCEVNGQPATPSLLADLGDIDPNASAVARWVMTCSLSGQFVEFTADFSHSDELGGELTSLLEATNTHFLVRDVLVDVAGRDSIRDFLAKDGGVYRVYESEGMDTDVADQSSSSSLNGSADDYTLSTPITAGFIFVQMPDPHNGQKALKEVVRSDAKHIKSENAWLSKTRNGQAWDYFINLFDANTTGSYSVAFEELAEPAQAPVLQFIPDRTVQEGEQLSFIVEATDPDGTSPSLSAAPLPALSTFTDLGDGTGTFDWISAEGQAGQYEITFTASDGVLEDSQRVTITVQSFADTDGDGMDDAWEQQHFGDLSRDGTGDFDGDGISDLDEFLGATDPVSSNAPTTPQISSPPDPSEVTVLQPDLVILNSTDPDGDAVTYEFEIYLDDGMTNLVASQSNVSEGQETTSWTIPVELSDNSWYHWRVRATDGIGFSLWAYGNFFVNTANDPPGSFNISSPEDGAEVTTLTPTLEVTNSVDLDEDDVTYTFEVYDDSSMSTLVASSPDITETGGTTSWQVELTLEDNTLHYWKAIATDEHGAWVESPAASFFVNTYNDAPGEPVISTPEDGSEVEVQELDLVVGNASDLDQDALKYFFELDTVDTFDSAAKQTSGEVTEGVDFTSWYVAALDDNTLYHWRVKARDDELAESPWALGDFFVNTANDIPSVPTVRNPGEGAWVQSVTPSLELNDSTDVDYYDIVTYWFEVYSDPVLSDLVVQRDPGDPTWVVQLDDNTWYYWQAQAQDNHGATSGWTTTSSFLVNASNDIPVVYPGTEAIINEGDAFTRSGSFTDPDPNDTWTATVDYGDGSGSQPLALTEEKTFSLSYVYADNGTYIVTVVVSDDKGGVGTADVTVTVDNVAPTVDLITAPIDPVQVGTEITASASFADAGVLDTHTATWDWGDGSTSDGTVDETEGTVTGSHTYDTPGVYTVTVTVTDDDGASVASEPFRYVVVYDPAGGFVTGGGWINSPEGAYTADPSLTGKAKFGFVSKYKKRATVPTGQTQFQFKVADLNFHSDTYQWLVVAGARAKYKGTGTINGEGDYGFMLTAIDGAQPRGGGVDKFRMKIWDKDDGDTIVYDNQPDADDDAAPNTVIQGGSIVIHDDK